MRLICPNCSAQYEIDVTLIPDEGRDVQCSNCGHTWFELPPPASEMAELAPAPDDAPEPEEFDDDYDDGFDDDEDEQFGAPSQAAQAIAAATEDVAERGQNAPASEPFKDTEDPFDAAMSEFLPGSDDGTDEDDPADVEPVPTTTLKARRPADAANMDVLRQEAQRELTQRRAPPSESLESQTDLGLEDISNRNTPSRALRARMARSSGDTAFDAPTDTASEADYQAPQRDLLPDIDEINSTLKQNEPAADPAKAAAKRGGFRLGFTLMLLLAVVAIIIYAFAPQIAQAVPGSENALIRFVDTANQLRDWIDGLLA